MGVNVGASCSTQGGAADGNKRACRPSILVAPDRQQMFVALDRAHKMADGEIV